MQPTTPPFFPPPSGRTHEVCGAGAVAFALALSAHLRGPFMWVHESWDTRQIHPGGIADITNPADLILCHTKTQTETLAVAEDALRSGAVSLVVMQLSAPLGLTEGRRLQLAARAGKSTGLGLISEGMGSNAAETRWRCTPVFAPDAGASDSTLQKWELIKNKSGTLSVCYVRWDRASRRLLMVPAPSK